MAAIHYKFKSVQEYKTLTFEGLHISVSDLKRAICERESIKAEQFDLVLSNAQTKREYLDEKELIPRNSSVIVQRTPRENARKMPKVQDRTAEMSGIVAQKGKTDMSAASSHLTSDVDWSKMSEQERLHHMKQVSTSKYHQSNFQKPKHSILSGIPPATYTCNRCRQPGHWNKNCPQNTTRRLTTGIPNQELMVVTKDNPNAYYHPSGNYVVPIMHQAARDLGKKEAHPFAESSTSASQKAEQSTSAGMNKSIAIPTELKCPLCEDLLKDAVLAVCCGDSFCDDCIRPKLIESETKQCPNPRCMQSGVSPDVSLFPNMKMREACENFRNETGYVYSANKGSAVSDQQQRMRIDLTQQAGGLPAVLSSLLMSKTMAHLRPAPTQQPQQHQQQQQSSATASPFSGATPEGTSPPQNASQTPDDSAGVAADVQPAQAPTVVHHQQQQQHQQQHQQHQQPHQSFPIPNMALPPPMQMGTIPPYPVTMPVSMGQQTGVQRQQHVMRPTTVVQPMQSSQATRLPMATVAPITSVSTQPHMTMAVGSSLPPVTSTSATHMGMSTAVNSAPVAPPGVNACGQPPPPGMPMGLIAHQSGVVRPPPPIASSVTSSSITTTSIPGVDGQKKDAWDEFLEKKDSRRRKKRRYSTSSSSSSESASESSSGSSGSRSPRHRHRHRSRTPPRRRRRSRSPSWVKAAEAAVPARRQRQDTLEWLNSQANAASSNLAPLAPIGMAPPVQAPFIPRPQFPAGFPPPLGFNPFAAAPFQNRPPFLPRSFRPRYHAPRFPSRRSPDGSRRRSVSPEKVRDFYSSRNDHNQHLMPQTTERRRSRTRSPERYARGQRQRHQSTSPRPPSRSAAATKENKDDYEEQPRRHTRREGRSPREKEQPPVKEKRVKRHSADKHKKTDKSIEKKTKANRRGKEDQHRMPSMAGSEPTLGDLSIERSKEEVAARRRKRKTSEKSSAATTANPPNSAPLEKPRRSDKKGIEEAEEPQSEEVLHFPDSTTTDLATQQQMPSSAELPSLSSLASDSQCVPVSPEPPQLLSDSSPEKVVRADEEPAQISDTLEAKTELVTSSSVVEHPPKEQLASSIDDTSAEAKKKHKKKEHHTKHRKSVDEPKKDDLVDLKNDAGESKRHKKKRKRKYSSAYQSATDEDGERSKKKHHKKKKRRRESREHSKEKHGMRSRSRETPSPRTEAVSEKEVFTSPVKKARSETELPVSPVKAKREDEKVLSSGDRPVKSDSRDRSADQREHDRSAEVRDRDRSVDKREQHRSSDKRVQDRSADKRERDRSVDKRERDRSVDKREQDRSADKRDRDRSADKREQRDRSADKRDQRDRAPRDKQPTNTRDRKDTKFDDRGKSAKSTTTTRPPPPVEDVKPTGDSRKVISAADIRAAERDKARRKLEVKSASPVDLVPKTEPELSKHAKKPSPEVECPTVPDATTTEKKRKETKDEMAEAAKAPSAFVNKTINLVIGRVGSSKKRTMTTVQKSAIREGEDEEETEIKRPPVQISKFIRPVKSLDNRPKPLPFDKPKSSFDKTVVVTSNRNRRLVSMEDDEDTQDELKKRVVNVNPGRSAELSITVGEDGKGKRVPVLKDDSGGDSRKRRAREEDNRAFRKRR